jgi:hypothetical protein
LRSSKGGEVDRPTSQGHFIQVFLIFPQQFTLVIDQFLGAEFLDHFTVTTALKNCLE